MWKRKPKTFLQMPGRKYGGKKVDKHGYTWDSLLELALYERLLMMERGGALHTLKVKPGTVFLSPARIQYRPDFNYVNAKTGEVEWAEAKGFPNDKWPMKKKLWKSFGPGTLHIYMGSVQSFRITETIVPIPANLCPHCGKDILKV